MTVKQVQNLLAYLGFYGGDIDGINGPGTKAACRAFQKAFPDLQVDGIPGPATQSALKHAVAEGIPETPKIPASDSSVLTTPSFWDEIEYFSREEFRCRCGGKYCSGFPAEPDETLVRLVNDLRKQAGKPAYPSSGLRCFSWNLIQGGVPDSRHRKGKALDFCIDGLSGPALLAMAKADSRTRYAYIIDGSYVHVDVA